MESRFKQCREACGMTQKEAALSLGVSIQAVSYWETGARIPSPEKLMQIADLYGVTVDALFGREKVKRTQIPDDEPSEATVLQAKLSRLTDRQRNKIEAIVDEMLGDE